MIHPIVIVANTRTGSSAYSEYLSTSNNITNWQEPSLNPNTFEQFKNYAKEHKDYVLKIITYQIPNNSLYQSILADKSYKIKLTRQNKVDQIVSHYIADYTAIWNSNNKFARGPKYSVKIDRELINKAMNTVIKNDSIFDTLNVKFDEELIYEDIVKIIDPNTFGTQKIIPPVNYDLLRTTVQEEYDKYR